MKKRYLIKVVLFSLSIKAANNRGNNRRKCVPKYSFHELPSSLKNSGGKMKHFLFVGRKLH